jgi:hypothetical protein
MMKVKKKASTPEEYKQRAIRYLNEEDVEDVDSTLPEYVVY